MLRVDKITELRQLCDAARASGGTVGLVPTMGYLHAGHLSLVARARAENDFVVVTIFVNPLQFGPKEDFAAYPRDLAKDLEHCARAGVDAVFAPATARMYEPGFCSNVDVGVEAEGMEGEIRPGHFRGVATVVARLFALSLPHRAYFGEKDAQQLAVITRMTRDLGFPIEIVRCAIVREPDGLAMSSRNRYLSTEDPRLHFGLGRATRVDELVVRTPNGRVTRIRGVAADRIVGVG